MQRDCGLMRGKGGSMHLTDTSKGVMGSYAIIGAHLPMAVGSAWRAQYLGHDDVATVFFGDGTTNIGAFHEALNYAVVYKLPVVFVCENNNYMEYTPIESITAVKNPAADRASAYGLESIIIDGNDADSAILEHIKENRCIVATMDKELKNKIKQLGGSILSIHNDKIVLEN